ncbi:AMP-dependent synthetase [Motiliproteus coralliicola]|uniref:AMP-dependent synthetase n=1 Tax=Motiliproteus coralliicola TaxID=2283196 RepID=A0A369WVR3_9GAMM|nr:AMP-binding protein [Motiliproteus coralliicola]RDE24636.1 AMP-dependent synthetase [Motiliproteus coralliicola]
MNLGSLITRSARFWGDQLAVKDERKSLTYRELDQRSNQLANALQSLELFPGDRVGVLAWNRAEIIEVEVALYKGGFVRAPINARLSDTEAVHVCNDAQAQVLIVDPEHLDAAKLALDSSDSVRRILVMGDSDLVDPKDSYEQTLTAASSETVAEEMEPEDLAVLHYTSGSSGVLKAAMQTVGNRHSVLQKLIYRGQLHADSQEICIHVGPITHASGMSIMPLLSQGHCNLLMSRFDADDFLATVEREQATQTYLVPTMINRILSSPNRDRYDISSLKMIRYGAAPISPARLKEAIEFFGPILNQGYGAGETCSSVCVLTEADHASALNGHPERLSSCGRPLFATEVKIVDDAGVELPVGEAGEMVIRGPDVMKGYWNAPDLTEEVLKDGYYHTGDIAYADEQGYLFIIDRKKDMIVAGGFNVYPNEVENALYQHPDVFEACVVGAPDPDMGESVKAVVVLKPGAKTSAESLINHCAELLGRFKKPNSVEFESELPKNGNGKIQRREVRDRYWQNSERKV